MSLFRRSRDAADTNGEEPRELLADEVDGDQPAPAPNGVRENGPWDVSEVDDPAAGGRANLGALWLPGAPGLEVRIDGNPETGKVAAITLVLGDGALQILPFAAPRTENIWEEVRGDIRAGITKDGGVVDEAEGPLGPELVARVPFTDDKGNHSLQPARFIGVDGPRWFLRGVFSGRPAVEPEAGEKLLALFRNIVVVRGSQPMAPREPLPLTLPSAPVEVTDEEEEPAPTSDDELKPFERGPEITEIH
jgi:hypothetical protein